MRPNAKRMVLAGSLIAAGVVSVIVWRSQPASNPGSAGESVSVAVEPSQPDPSPDESEPKSEGSAWIKSEEDGSHTVFERTSDKRSVIKTTYAPDKTIKMKAIYLLDAKGRELKCNLYDSVGTDICMVRFGYSKRPGPTFDKLVQEQFYDTREKRFFPGKHDEKPVHIFMYRYNQDGSSERPVGMTLIEGKTAEEIFGCNVEPHALPDFDELEKIDDVAPLNLEPVRPDH
ncbi:hypothetical protein [Haloferula sp. A504]|uniref:hypothetical protein n=1 Tax=Haloferula sp. A504 TaxID=3373601 RepID=UPI0031C3BEA2|nr:hypothetical protein [Verrucomicrobiaceae bacterium E54]